jgi:hypothetical protein
MRTSTETPPPKVPRRRLRLVAAVSAGALVLTPIAAVATTHVVAAKSVTSKAISAVLGAGVMGKVNGAFRPDRPVNRGLLAVTVHRSSGRLAVQENLGSLNASSGSTELGSVKLKVDGAANKRQGVLVSVQMQLDHDNALASNCGASFTLTKNASPTVLGSWSQELYSGPTSGQEDNIAFSFFAIQDTQTFPNYHLNGSNSCTQALFTDLDIMYAQNFPFGLNGQANPAPLAPKQATPKHDR